MHAHDNNSLSFCLDWGGNFHIRGLRSIKILFVLQRQRHKEVEGQMDVVGDRIKLRRMVQRNLFRLPFS